MIRRFGDFSAAEDAVQEALLAAAMQWPAQGVPDNPRGWLIQVAARRMIDHIRSELARRRRDAEVTIQDPPELQVLLPPDSGVPTEQDDTLILLFMCCHPALTRSSAIALTLRAVGGLTTAEIARAFLVPEATMAQRISRAKERIKASGVPFQLPNDRERAERLGSVLHALYLIFNEGYTSSSGLELQRSDLANEAIRLTRALHHLLSDETEVAGLLALMLLTDARREARTGPGRRADPAHGAGSAALGSQGDRGRRRAHQRGASPRSGRALSAAGGDRRAARRGSSHRGYRLAADSGALRSPQAHVRQSDGGAQSCDRRGHGPRAGDGSRSCSKLSTPTSGWRVTIASKRYARICSRWPAIVSAAIARYQAAASRTTSIPERNYLNTKAARLTAEPQ